MYSREQVTTAGIWMGVLLSVLAFSGGIDLIHKIVPTTVVSGTQLGVGISLAVHGLDMVSALEWFQGVDSLALAIMAALICMWFLRDGKHPVGLYLFGAASLIAIVTLATHQKATTGVDETWSLVPVLTWALSSVHSADWRVGFWEGAFPQLPLSTLNSVISVCCLADTLYPSRRHGPNNTVLTRKEACLSVGLMNLLLCPLGAMPNCHGAGGLAGQHQFGARHGTSIVVLGLIKMSLAVFAGSLILPFLDAIPVSILGILLVVSGQELARTGLCVLLDEHGQTLSTFKLNVTASLVTATIILGLKKTHYGAIIGCLVHYLYVQGNCLGTSESYNRLDHRDSVEDEQSINVEGTTSEGDTSLLAI